MSYTVNGIWKSNEQTKPWSHLPGSTGFRGAGRILKKKTPDPLRPLGVQKCTVSDSEKKRGAAKKWKIFGHIFVAECKFNISIYRYLWQNRIVRLYGLVSEHAAGLCKLLLLYRFCMFQKTAAWIP